VTTDPVRERAVGILTAVESGTFLNRALESEGDVFGDGSAERARLHRLTAGTTKFRLRLDTELDRRLPQGVRSLPSGVRQILRLALYELRFAGVPGYAAVNAATELTRRAGFAGLTGVVNGVLRNAVRTGEPDLPPEGLERLAVTASHPRWLLEEIAARYGVEAAAAYAEWNNQPPPLWLRVNEAVSEVEEELQALRRLGIEAREEGPLPGWLTCDPGALPTMRPVLDSGRLRVQDPSAALAVLAAGPVENLLLADICAAPGGKCSHLAERGRGRARVIATDADPERYRRLAALAATHGGLGLEIQEWDRVMDRTGEFDLVLVDAPCSNTGVLRRRADARWRLGPETAREMAAVQIDLLERAAELLTPAGVLIYSTCSVLAGENEVVVERFLSHHTAFIPDGTGPSFPAGFGLEPGLALSLPWKHGLDGAFTARLKRAGT